MSKVLLKKMCITFTLITTLLPISANAAALSFFGGDVIAKITLANPVSTTKKNQIKIELISKNGQAYDLDPSDLKLGLFMTTMPEMGTEQLNVVSVNDAGGSPIAGVFSVTDLKFGMSGRWTLQFTIPSPKDSNQIETQNLEVMAQ